MNITAITKREANLIELCVQAKEAGKAFTEACQFAASEAETTPAVVRRYIAALAGEKANAVMTETAQLTMLFTSLPTVTTVAGVRVECSAVV
jgi:hypothetical protein